MPVPRATQPSCDGCQTPVRRPRGERGRVYCDRCRTAPLAATPAWMNGAYGHLGEHRERFAVDLQRSTDLKLAAARAAGIIQPSVARQLLDRDSAYTRSTALAGLVHRSFAFALETRSNGRMLEGYAAVFNTATRIRDAGGDFDETIRPGAFARSLKVRTPILMWDHGKDPRVGTVPIGAINRLAEDSRGLHVEAELFDNAVVEPVRQAIAAKAVKGMSFRFGVPEGGDTWTRGGYGSVDRREVRDADVHELGPVAFPAYDGTSVSVRSGAAPTAVTWTYMGASPGFPATVCGYRSDRWPTVDAFVAEVAAAVRSSEFDGQALYECRDVTAEVMAEAWC